MATITTNNGIDVDQLLQTIDAINADPDLGSFTFRARSTWQEGTHRIVWPTRFRWKRLFRCCDGD